METIEYKDRYTENSVEFARHMLKEADALSEEISELPYEMQEKAKALVKQFARTIRPLLIDTGNVCFLHLINQTRYAMKESVRGLHDAYEIMFYRHLIQNQRQQSELLSEAHESASNELYDFQDRIAEKLAGMSAAQ